MASSMELEFDLGSGSGPKSFQLHHALPMALKPARVNKIPIRWLLRSILGSTFWEFERSDNILSVPPYALFSRIY